ncbi:type II toxin-antitoxin system Phd/YefM family antitoxin [Reyranella sp. CPCC 100927]|nr:type II toxin-antitoxin system Phd/YefM family antitoxin [Reyranella sp. CPCC 100927]
MGKPVTIHAAKTRFSELIRRVEAGEVVVIARGDKPVAKLVPIDQPQTRRRPGTMKGLIALDDAFWDPLPDEELELWGLK